VRVSRQGTLLAFLFSAFGVATVNAAAFAPDPVQTSSLSLLIQEVGSVPLPEKSWKANFNSPLAVDNSLYIVDQTGKIYRENASGVEVTVLDAASVETSLGLDLSDKRGFQNITASTDNSHMYVSMVSSVLPTGITAAGLPDTSSFPDTAKYYTADSYQIIYKYEIGTDGGLTNPTAVTAFEMQQNSGAHAGGGMLTLPDGRILLATGDNVNQYFNGSEAPQSTDSHLGKLLIIDPSDGEVTVAAKGVRNVQRITWADDEKTTIAFADIGANTAEEIDVVALDDLLDTSSVENFGWGIAEDGKVREGSFYVDYVDGTLVGVGDASADASFIQPFAEIGRPEDQTWFSITGPVTSSTSFDLISALFADLKTGSLFATTSLLDPLTFGAAVFDVDLFDALGNQILISDLSIKANRGDVRFFNFASGDAGLFVESSGKYYSLTEIAAVPLTSAAMFFLGGLGLLAPVYRQSRKQRLSSN